MSDDMIPLTEARAMVVAALTEAADLIAPKRKKPKETGNWFHGYKKDKGSIAAIQIRRQLSDNIRALIDATADAALPTSRRRTMSDDLVTRLRWAADHSNDCGEWNCSPSDLDDAADRIEELEAKLKIAVQALEGVRAFVRDLAPYADQGHTLVPALEKACTTLAELTGEKNT